MASGGFSRKRTRAVRAAATVTGLALLICIAVPGPVASESLNEDQIKAAYLYNFARYVEWPGAAHSSSDSALQIGVVGGGAVSELLRKTVAGKKVGSRSLRIVDFETPDEGRGSHILFIADEYSGSVLDGAIDQLAGTHVFVVADDEDFAKKGGVANFFISDSRVRFAINKKAAKNAGLKVSSKLLRLAELVD
ncbi:MAG: YfiR family protein [bacterium]|nr:YfiR family protein [bacterium]